MANDYAYKQIIVVRKDLKMRTGKAIAQSCHASLAATLHNQDREEVKNWLAGRFAKIAVYVNSEQELLDLHEAANQAGLITSLIKDAGFTEFHGVPTYTCIAIGPGKIQDIDKLTGDLPLL